MKFNEKLIELRKKEGLSQEELGYKLNVTRQTVSKWELGQTTPDMDKLTELSKIFNVSVDELVNETENNVATENTVIEDQTIDTEEAKGNKIKVIIIGILVVILIWIVVKMVTGFTVFNKITGEQGLFDKFFSLFDKAFSQQQNIMEGTEGVFNNVQNMMDNVQDVLDNKFEQTTITQFDINSFNNLFEMYAGTEKGAHVIVFLDHVITNNKTEERKITIKYSETETLDENEIKNIKRKIETFDDYEVTLEYDADGFIYKAIIEKF